MKTAAFLALCALTSAASAQVPIDNSLAFNSPSQSATQGSPGGSYSLNWSDDFNRPNSATLGADWLTQTAPDMAIVGNLGKATGTSPNQWTMHALASVPYAQAVAKVDITPYATGHFVALIFGAGGTNTVFLKVQDNNSDGILDTFGFYTGINGSPWPGATVGFGTLAIPTAQARVTCYFTNNGDSAHIDLDHNFDGTPEEQLVSNGLLGSGLVLNGTGIGIGCWGMAEFDNFIGGDGQFAPPPTNYCTAKITANSCAPSISWTGTASATAGSGFLVKGTNFINNKSCLLFYGVSGQGATPFQGGFLCVKSPIKRTPGTNTFGNPPPNDCSGVPGIDMNLFAVGGGGGTPLAALTVPGTVVDCQWWGRDPGFVAPNNTQLSNGLEYTVGP
jgi:hypothetical protein